MILTDFLGLTKQWYPAAEKKTAVGNNGAVCLADILQSSTKRVDHGSLASTAKKIHQLHN